MLNLNINSEYSESFSILNNCIFLNFCNISEFNFEIFLDTFQNDLFQLRPYFIIIELKNDFSFNIHLLQELSYDLGYQLSISKNNIIGSSLILFSRRDLMAFDVNPKHITDSFFEYNPSDEEINFLHSSNIETVQKMVSSLIDFKDDEVEDSRKIELQILAEFFD